MKTVLVQLTLLALAALYGDVKGYDDHTYVSNLSSKWTINATTIYNFPFASSNFIDRQIGPGSWQADQYSHTDCNFNGDGTVDVRLSIANDHHCTYDIIVGCDVSVVGSDKADLSGVDMYVSVYGNINEPSGSVLLTLSGGSVC